MQVISIQVQLRQCLSTLEKLRTQISRVILLGPAHRVYVQGIALPSNTHFATPLGNVPDRIECC